MKTTTEAEKIRYIRGVEYSITIIKNHTENIDKLLKKLIITSEYKDTDSD